MAVLCTRADFGLNADPRLVLPWLHDFLPSNVIAAHLPMKIARRHNTRALNVHYLPEEELRADHNFGWRAFRLWRLPRHRTREVAQRTHLGNSSFSFLTQRRRLCFCGASVGSC